MRTLLLALVAAAVPPALFAPCVGFPSPLGDASSPDAAARWLSIALATFAVLAMFAAIRFRGFTAGAALAGALATALFPAMADAVLSPRALAIEWTAGVAALGFAEAGIPRLLGREPWKWGREAVFAAGCIAAGILNANAEQAGAAALVPAMAAFAPAAGVVAGTVAELTARRVDLAAGVRAAVATGLGLVLAGSGWVAVERTSTWSDPAAFWARAVRERPDAPAPLGAAAGVAFRAGDREGAVERLRRFAEAVHRSRGADGGPDSSRRVGAEGAASAAAAILESPRAGEEEIAVEALRAAEALCPTSAVTVRILGEAQLRRGDSIEAIVTLERATALDREDAAAWEGLARARLLSGRPAEALDAALRARGLRPASKEILVTCAEAMLAAGRDAEALEMLHGALFPLPGDPLLARAYADAHLQVARREASAGERGRARRRLLAGLEAVPKHEGCLDLLSSLQAQFEAERPEADKLLVPGADGSVTLDRWMRHATWLCRWGCYEEAGAHFDDMLKRVGSLADVHYHRGREFWESRGTVEGVREAVASYRAALARDPKHAEAWNRLWRCLATLGKNDEAAQAARRFLEVAPEHPDGVEAEVFLGHEPGDPPDAPPRTGR